MMESTNEPKERHLMLKARFLSKEDQMAEEKQCYLHEIDDDPHGTPFDETKHHICYTCAIKLWNIAKEGLEFEVCGENELVSLQLKRVKAA